MDSLYIISRRNAHPHLVSTWKLLSLISTRYFSMRIYLLPPSRICKWESNCIDQ